MHRTGNHSSAPRLTRIGAALCAALVVPLVAASSAFAVGWTESGDAGDLPATAQVPHGTGVIDSITGEMGANDADMYKVCLDGAGTFAAFTIGGSGSATFDTQLFLLDATGKGVEANDDFSSGTSKSYLQAGGLSPTTAGTYYLAISGSDKDPVSPGGLIFPDDPTTTIFGPTGPGGGSPISGWESRPNSKSGDYTIGLSGANFCPTSLATPTLTTTASPRVPIGGAVFDTAHLSGGNNPTGTITFTLYGPQDFNCTKPAAFTDTKTVSGNGDYASSPFTPTATGTYRFTASYSGDANNGALPPTSCFDLAETTFVDNAQPTLDTAASPSSVALGAAVHDTATLAGGFNPTGTITFSLYGPDTCSGPAVFTSSPVTVNGNANYTSPEFTPTAVGTYVWRARYSGDAHNNAVPLTGCPDPSETVVVTQGTSTPTLTTTASPRVPIGGAIFDTAHLSGGNSPTGTITFNLYGPQDFNCTKPAAFTDTKTVSGNGDYASSPFTPTATGTYRFTASYSGDPNNVAVPATSCFDLAETTFVDNAQPTLDTAASPTVQLGGHVFDTATLAGGFNPTGTITFSLYGPNTCSGPAVFTSPPVTVNGNAVYTSPSFAPTAVGTYVWRARYSGDASNSPVPLTGCPDPSETVVVTPATGGESTLTCTPNPTGLSCTLSDPHGLKFGRFVPSVGNAEPFLFPCSPTPTTTTSKELAPNTRYQVFVTDCSDPAVKSSFVIRPNGEVRKIL